jgi:hypothetical protein
MSTTTSDSATQQQPQQAQNEDILVSEEHSQAINFESSNPFEGVKHVRLRHLSVSLPTRAAPHNGILDNGADQVMISINVATVQCRSEQFLEVDGPLSGRASASQ